MEKIRVKHTERNEKKKHVSFYVLEYNSGAAYTAIRLIHLTQPD